MNDPAPIDLPVLAARDYKTDYKPVWCPGCGDFGVLNALSKAMAALALAPEDVAVIAGIGCSSRLAAYVNAYSFHGVHGRALPLAAGLAVSRPDLTVIAAGGDGDGFSIGGNHFLHACRRNVNFTYLVMDNSVYGMTKGQASPTTEEFAAEEAEHVRLVEKEIARLDPAGPTPTDDPDPPNEPL
jgi:2-oxoglutarate/2-oxoacid ferredoxin oxidoreductase subunit beta